MKKTYIKPYADIDKVETQEFIALSKLDGEADPSQPTYSRESRFSGWDEEE